MKWSYRLLVGVCLIGLGATSFAQENTPLVLVTHDSFAMSEDTLAEFSATTGIALEILRVGDTGALVNQALLSAGNPLGDVLFGVDNTFLSRALGEDLFLPYRSPALAEVAEEFWLEGEYRVTPIDYGDVCLNYDISYFTEANLAVPTSLAELTQPEYRGLLVVQNPATSSPGLAFLLATIANFGEEGNYTYLNYWRDLIANDVLIVDGWEQAYFGYFTAASEDGDRPLVVSYASSPPFTINAETGEAMTASIVADGTCFRQVEYAGILRDTEREAEAQALIDFLLGATFQAEVPNQMYVFPVREDVELPEDFAMFAQIPLVPASIPAVDIESNREAWLEAWLELVGQS